MEPTSRRTKILTPRTDIAIPDRYVSMSNAIARGAQGFNLSQKRIIALALAMTDSVPVRDLIAGQREGWTVRLLAHDYATTYEVDVNTAYEQLQDGCRNLLKTLWRTIDNGKKGLVITEGPWCVLAKYTKGEGRVDLSFSPRVAPHLLALRGVYTTYRLKQAAALRSIYAWRLFECLQSWRTKGRWTPDIEEFILAMEAPDSCRKDFGNLRKRVIEPAVEELKNDKQMVKEGLLLEWGTKKAGRKVIGLEFKFRTDPQGKLAL